MALTQAQWYAKLRSWVPKWFLDSPQYQAAVFQALAKILSTTQADAEDFISQTYISEADGNYIDLHGAERKVERAAGELDPAYSVRVRIISNTAVNSALSALVDACLNNGSAQVIENLTYGFWNDGLFFNDDEAIHLDGTKGNNWMTFVIPIQTGGDADQIKTAIIRVIDENKAFGVFYDVLYQV